MLRWPSSKQISESIKAGGLLDVADEYGNHHWLNPSIILEVVGRAEPVTPDVRPQRTDLPKPECGRDSRRAALEFRLSRVGAHTRATRPY